MKALNEHFNFFFVGKGYSFFFSFSFFLALNENFYVKDFRERGSLHSMKSGFRQRFGKPVCLRLQAKYF